jgi:hypothetical protein
VRLPPLGAVIVIFSPVKAPGEPVKSTSIMTEAAFERRQELVKHPSGVFRKNIVSARACAAMVKAAAAATVAIKFRWIFISKLRSVASEPRLVAPR